MELKDILEFTGIEAKDMDEFKSKFAEKWHTPDTFFQSKEYKDQVGKMNGSFVSKAKAISKQFGVEITGAEIEGKKSEEIFDLAMQKLQAANNAAMEEDKKKYAGTKDENYAKLEKTYADLKRDYSTLEESNKKIKTDWDNDKQTYASQLKDKELKFHKKNLYENPALIKDDEYRFAGFQSKLEEKYSFDLDEKENMVAFDRKSGQKIPNPRVASAFLSPQEILEKEAVEAKMWKINKDGGKPAPQTGTAPAGSGWASANKDGKPEAPKNILAINHY